jgi:hypothetical protein
MLRPSFASTAMPPVMLARVRLSSTATPCTGSCRVKLPGPACRRPASASAGFEEDERIAVRVEGRVADDVAAIGLVAAREHGDGDDGLAAHVAADGLAAVAADGLAAAAADGLAAIAADGLAAIAADGLAAIAADDLAARAAAPADGVAADGLAAGAAIAADGLAAVAAGDAAAVAADRPAAVAADSPPLPPWQAGDEQAREMQSPSGGVITFGVVLQKRR